jgi:hypothetical protein
MRARGRRPLDAARRSPDRCAAFSVRLDATSRDPNSSAAGSHSPSIPARMQCSRTPSLSLPRTYEKDAIGQMAQPGSAARPTATRPGTAPLGRAFIGISQPPSRLILPSLCHGEAFEDDPHAEIRPGTCCCRRARRFATGRDGFPDSSARTLATAAPAGQGGLQRGGDHSLSAHSRRRRARQSAAGGDRKGRSPGRDGSTAPPQKYREIAALAGQ